MEPVHLQHVGHRELAHDEGRSDAVVERLPKVVVGEAQKWAIRCETNVVDNDVDSAELVDGGLHHAFAVRTFECIGSEREACTAG